MARKRITYVDIAQTERGPGPRLLCICLAPEVNMRRCGIRCTQNRDAVIVNVLMQLRRLAMSKLNTADSRYMHRNDCWATPIILL